MLLEFFLNLILGLCRGVLIPDHIEDLPQTFLTVLASLGVILVDGLRVINTFIDETYIGGLLVFVCAFNTVIWGYRLFMWAVKKIPFIGIE